MKLISAFLVLSSLQGCAASSLRAVNEERELTVRDAARDAANDAEIDDASDADMAPLTRALMDMFNEDVEHLDLEVVVEGGERQLFPLLPGTKCPTGHRCHTRNPTNSLANASPMGSSLKKNMVTPLAMSIDWLDFNSKMDTVVRSKNFCTRRDAMARAAGMIAGVAAATVASPAFAAETKEVKMGTDSGLLAFEPAKLQICKGDTVMWINNKAGPHNVVFDENNIPGGVDQEKISMEDQLGEPGDSFSMTFDTLGNYNYYCEPHRGAGMNGVLVVA